MIRTVIFFALTVFSACSFAQGCFNNCRQHLTEPLRANENIETRLRKSQRVLENLVGCKSPAFNVTTINGERLNSHDLKGKVIVMNFWFESCKTCVEDVSDLNLLSQRFNENDVVFIAFSRDNDSQIKSFLKGNRFSYKIVSNQYNVNEDFCVIGGWPMNMIIDKKGFVRFIEAGGFRDEDDESTLYDRMLPIVERQLSK